MNRKQRRAAHIKHRKPTLSPVEMAAKLKAARPTDVHKFVLWRNGEGKVEGDLEPITTDWSWLDDIDREGYDPRAINGPTYWRVDDTRHVYYSVFARPDGHLVLLINDVPANAELAPEFMPDSQYGKEMAERRNHPWLSLSYQISPAVAADIKTEADEEAMLKRMALLLPKSYDFAVAYELPMDKPIGLIVDDTQTGRKYLIHVMPDEQLIDIDYAPADFTDRLQAQGRQMEYVH